MSTVVIGFFFRKCTLYMRSIPKKVRVGNPYLNDLFHKCLSIFFLANIRHRLLKYDISPTHHRENEIILIFSSSH